MTFAYPLFLWLAGAAALAVVGLHYLTTMQQRPAAFPTTRFIPEQQIRHSTVSPRFSDLRLMLLRIVALLLLGLAVAQPRFAVGHVPLVTIVAVDVSAGVRRDSSWMQEVSRETERAAVVIAFDQTAWVGDAGNVNAALKPDTFSPPRVGQLSPALVEALRAAHRLRERADSVELVVMAPLVTGSTDEGTLAIRAEWPGAIRLVRAPVSDWPTAGAVRLEWADSGNSRFWQQQSQADSVLGVHTDDATLINRFARRWVLSPDVADSVMVTGRWIDGKPAMVEQVTATGCTRSLGFVLPADGDLLFRPEFDRFLGSLRNPCTGSRQPDALPAAVQQALAGSGGLLKTAELPVVAPLMAPLTPWLLLLVALLFLLEFRVRRGTTDRAVMA